MAGSVAGCQAGVATGERIPVIERDDPAEPGLLTRRDARILPSWDPTLAGWAWGRLTEAASVVGPMAGPFAAAEVAWQAAEETLGGRYEDNEAG